jgi:hypothetical protein
MSITFNNYADTVVKTITGTATVATLYVLNGPASTSEVDGIVGIATDTVTNGDATYKIAGRVDGVAKLTGETFSFMQNLFWNVASSGLTATFASGSTTPHAGRCGSKGGEASTSSTCTLFLNA